MSYIYAIDGACRGIGKADCRSVGAAFKLTIEQTEQIDILADNTSAQCFVKHEANSTSQRGELYGLLLALKDIHKEFVNKEVFYENVYIVTDSEYIYNAITNEWPQSWSRKGWVTALQEPVKNKELWLQILKWLEALEGLDVDFNIYHVKGHVVPFGKKKAADILSGDKTGINLLKQVSEKFYAEKDSRIEKYNHALELFNRNHGYYPPLHLLDMFIILNMCVDLIATTGIDYPMVFDNPEGRTYYVHGIR